MCRKKRWRRRKRKSRPEDIESLLKFGHPYILADVEATESPSKRHSSICFWYNLLSRHLTSKVRAIVMSVVDARNLFTRKYQRTNNSSFACHLLARVKLSPFPWQYITSLITCTNMWKKMFWKPRFNIKHYNIPCAQNLTNCCLSVRVKRYDLYHLSLLYEVSQPITEAHFT